MCQFKDKADLFNQIWLRKYKIKSNMEIFDYTKIKACFRIILLFFIFTLEFNPGLFDWILWKTHHIWNSAPYRNWWLNAQEKYFYDI